MATVTKTFLDVTFVISTDDVDNIEVEINSEDNNDISCYIPNVDYYARLYRSRNDMVITARANIGSISLHNVSTFEEVDEEITFSNGADASSSKFVKSNFLYTPVGRIYDSSLNEASGISLISTEGSKTIRASENIFGIYNINYQTEYMTYVFRASRAGNLMLSFIGS